MSDGEVIEDANTEEPGFQFPSVTLAPGQTVEAKVLITLTSDATDYKNAVTIFNDLNPVDGNVENLEEWQQNNEDVTLDEDQRDYTVHKIPNGELKVDKMIRQSALPGGWMTYKITAKNAGPDDLVGVEVVDHGGHGHDISTIQFMNPTKGSFEDNVWTIGDLAVDEEVEIYAIVKIDEGTEGETITNNVTISNPQNPKEFDPEGEGQVNEGVDADNDQFDATEFTLPTPDVPVTPPSPLDPTAPGEPGPAPQDPPAPVEPEKPQLPQTPKEVAEVIEAAAVKTGGQIAENPVSLLGGIAALGGLISAFFYGLSRRRTE